METKIIDAKEMCAFNKEEYKKDIERIHQILTVQPQFVIINASDDESNKRYIKNKIKEGESVGLDVKVIEFPKNCTQYEIVNLIEACKEAMVPVILQLPIYDHLNKDLLLEHIDYTIDADGFTKEWIGNINLKKENGIVPATPKGVINLLEFHEVDVKGKVALVIGKSNHVGKPLSSLLMNRDATVLVANKDTKDLASLVRMADIIISCVGKVNLINPDDLKEGVVLIGVGFTYVNGKQILDFDLDEVVKSGKASLVSNRINCTGKATVNALIGNVIRLYKINLGLDI
jgi:methylenetetrahydrofolate dehydrogenase (NADP+)/methenyltetrahydrofolate cyclohydrolase